MCLPLLCVNQGIQPVCVCSFHSSPTDSHMPPKFNKYQLLKSILMQQQQSMYSFLDTVFLGRFSTFFAVTRSKFGANSTPETNTQITSDCGKGKTFDSNADKPRRWFAIHFCLHQRRSSSSCFSHTPLWWRPVAHTWAGLTSGTSSINSCLGKQT